MAGGFYAHGIDHPLGIFAHTLIAEQAKLLLVALDIRNQRVEGNIELGVDTGRPSFFSD